MIVGSGKQTDNSRPAGQRLTIMRANLVGLVSIGLLAGMLGCAREHEKVKAPNPHTTGFAQAGVSLVLDDAWHADNLATPHSLQPPTLVSEAGVIRVILLPADRTDPEAVADSLRASFDANPKAGKHTFRRQQFVSKSGVQGICVSYLELPERNGRVSEVQNHHYLVKNKAARCVAINYLAPANVEADTVSRTIRTTLALQ
jgi:hypothetical protein